MRILHPLYKRASSSLSLLSDLYARLSPQVLDLSGVAALAQEHSLCVEGEALKDLIRHWQVGSPSDPS